MDRHTIFTECALQTREQGAEREGYITGLAVVTDSETLLYEDAEYREYETIAPSCIGADFLAGQDVKLNLLHERASSFARWNRGAGSLSLKPGADGLHFEAAVPDCDLGRRAVALVSNGTYSGCSFEFWPKDYEITERTGADGKTEYVVRHTAFAKLGALTIGMDPAYSGTSVNAREEYAARHAQDGPDVQAARAEIAAREAAAREKAGRESRLRRLWLYENEVTEY